MPLLQVVMALIVVPAFAQQEQHEQEGKSEKQGQAKPERQQQRAKPAAQEQQAKPEQRQEQPQTQPAKQEERGNVAGRQPAQRRHCDSVPEATFAYLTLVSIPVLGTNTDSTLAKKLGSVLGKETTMLWTIFVILLVLWLLGLVTSYTLGGFIHILLVMAIVVLVIRLVQGRRVA